jgi:antitoxin VapB
MITLDDPDLEAMLRVIQEETGEPPAVVIRRVLARTLDLRPSVLTHRPRTGEAPPEEQERRRAIIERIQREVAALPVLDTRSADEILGYDENGLPT